MIFEREYWLKFVSSEAIDFDIARVNEAKIGEEIFRCSIWSSTDYFDTIVHLAKIQVHQAVNNDLGIVRYIKGPAKI